MSEPERDSAEDLYKRLLAAAQTNELNGVDLWMHADGDHAVRIAAVSYREEDLCLLVTYGHPDRVPSPLFTRTLDNFLDRFTRIPS